MKSIILSLTICLISHSFAFGQEKIDVIHLNNGDVVKGIIIENSPNNYVKIELEGGSILKYQYFDIERFTKETKEVSSPPSTQYLLPKDPYNSPNSQSQHMSDRIKKKRLTFGLMGGLNMANFIGDDKKVGTVDPDFSMKYAIGSFLTYAFNDHISIRPELLYIVKGPQYNYKEPGISENLIVTMHYLDISLLGMFVQGKGKVFAGPYLGIFLGGEYVYKEQIQDTTIQRDIKVDCGISENCEYVASPEFGLVLGGSYDVTTNISIEARYSLGLTTLDKKENWNNYSYLVEDFYNSGLQLMVSFSI